MIRSTIRVAMVSWLSRSAKYLAENRKLIVDCGDDE
jgi:hypothetical protein